MKKISLLFFVVFTIQKGLAQEVNIIPKPAFSSIKTGSFTVSPQTKIVVTIPELNKSATFLNDYLEKFYGFKLEVSNKSSSSNVIELNSNSNAQGMAGAYQMDVNAKKITSYRRSSRRFLWHSITYPAFTGAGFKILGHSAIEYY